MPRPKTKKKILKVLHIMSPNKRSIHSCEELGLGTNKSNFLAWNRVVGGQGITMRQESSGLRNKHNECVQREV